MNTFFDPKHTISTVNSKIEELRYSLELSIEQSKIIDEDSVNSILHNLNQIQTTLKPFSGEQIFGATFPAEYQELLNTVTTLGEVFLDEPTLSVDQMRMEIAAETSVINLAPYIVEFKRKMAQADGEK